MQAGSQLSQTPSCSAGADRTGNLFAVSAAILCLSTRISPNTPTAASTGPGRLQRKEGSEEEELVGLGAGMVPIHCPLAALPLSTLHLTSFPSQAQSIQPQ